MKRFVPALAAMIFFLAGQFVLAAPYAYVTQVLTGQVTVIDTEKNKKVTTINVGGAPFSIAFSPDGAKAYVASEQYLLDHVSVIDTLTHTVTATVPVGSYPIGIAALPDGSKVCVAGNNNLSPGLTVIDTAALTVTATIPFGTTPYAVAALPDSSKVYVTDLDDHTVTAVDTSSNIAETVPTAVPNAFGIAAHPDGTRVYVTSYLATDPLPTTGSIFVIDTSSNTITGTITVLGGLPGSVAFNPSGTRAYVAGDFERASLWVIDTATEAVVSTINVGKSPVSVDVTPDGKRVYVTTAYWDQKTDREVNHAVKAIDASTNKVISTIKVDGQPSSMGKFIGSVRYGLSILKDGSGTGTVASTNNTGSISCGAACEESYAIGRTVKLKATPDVNSVFKGWTGGCTGTKNTCTLVMTQDYASTATFRSDPTITVTPAKKDFKKVKLTKTSNAKFVVKNSIGNGKKDLAVTNIVSSNPVFNVSADGCTGIPVGPNKTCSFTVTFTPGGVGPESGTITISSNDPDAPSKEIALLGEGAN